MATNLAIVDKLLVLAQTVGVIKTKKETVNLALKEFLQRRQQEDLIDQFGEVEYVDDYDYKSQRDRHRKYFLIHQYGHWLSERRIL